MPQPAGRVLRVEAPNGYSRVVENLRFAFGNVVPIFLVVLVGWAARKARVVTSEYSEISTRLVFLTCMPALVFDSIYASDFKNLFSLRLPLFIIVATFAMAVILWLVAPLVSRERPVRGSFIQGGWRSNFVILTIPIIANVYGDEGRAVASVLVAFTMPFYNILSVLVLSANSRGQKPGGLRLLGSIATNPLILAVVLALPFPLLGIRLPPAVLKVVGYLSDAALPLSLIAIGADIAGRRLGGNRLPLAVATLFKVVLTPAFFLLGGLALGLETREVGIAALIGGAPTAIATYAMAKGMDNDGDLAADIILATTVSSSLSLVVLLFILREIGIA
jgi:predicted permease